MKCKYCPRKLRTPESRARGYGPICGQKLGFIPKPTPRALTPVKPVMTPTVHPDQTAIPIQPAFPTGDFAHCPGATGQPPEMHALWGCSRCNPIQHIKIEEI